MLREIYFVIDSVAGGNLRHSPSRGKISPVIGFSTKRLFFSRVSHVRVRWGRSIPPSKRMLYRGSHNSTARPTNDAKGGFRNNNENENHPNEWKTR